MCPLIQWQRGCTRCLDVCPADAISSIQGRIESRIEIDPFLCQGVGSCTSACPTGAIEFRLPETRRQQDTLAAWLNAYREAGGDVPVLRFITHDSLEAERKAGDVTPGHVIDAPLEELGAAGHDQWLTALANGASEVRIQLHDDMPPRLSAFLEHQIAQAHALLTALGHDTARIKLLPVGANSERDALPSLTPLTESSLSFTEPNKRVRLNQVLARLAELGVPSGERHAMPAGAAYGGIKVDSAACTLCHACVSNCPTPALKSGGDTPALSFLEADCVQCGLCEQACPEDAITLEPGFLAAPARETLNSGVIDIECNASTNNAERRRSADFSLSHFFVSVRFVSLKENHFFTLQDLAGRSVSVARGTVNVGQINQANREQQLNLSVVPVETLQEAFDLVTEGRVAAFAMDDILLSTMIAASMTLLPTRSQKRPSPQKSRLAY
ncbi:4Fe-4S binding protein [Halomonas sp. LY9]